LRRHGATTIFGNPGSNGDHCGTRVDPADGEATRRRQVTVG
jgi:hypothetical protein